METATTTTVPTTTQKKAPTKKEQFGNLQNKLFDLKRLREQEKKKNDGNPL